MGHCCFNLSLKTKTDHDEERQILTILVRVDDTQRGTADSLRELKLEIIIELGLEGGTFNL